MKPDMRVAVGSVLLANPVMTASGTAGHGAELSAYFDLRGIGAVVVKSLSAEPWEGNPAPRLAPVPGGMLNSVGLQNPGVEAWLRDELPALESAGATIVASIWGATVEGFEKAAVALADVGPRVVAVEVNVSCPNLEDRSRMFAHSCSATAEAVEATEGCRRPRWAKLSPNVTDVVAIAEAALGAGAAGLTLVNTLMGMSIDLNTRRSRLGTPGGGLSGPALHPVAVRLVHECREAFPTTPIIGVGGVATVEDAIELMLAGASAIQVGTASLRDPRAPARVARGIETWCRKHRVERVADLTGGSHG